MASEIERDDPDYDLAADAKDELEKVLRERAKEYLRMKKTRERQRALARAVEISHRKSRRSHQGRD